MELQLRSAEVILPQEIENLKQLKAELAPVLEKYNKLVVTEDGIKSAKSDKASLNRLKKSITEQRILIKKQYLEPYTLLENQCKEVIALIDEPLLAIDQQLKAFDDKEKEDKKSKLRTAFYQIPHHSWIEFEDVLPEKWANKTEKTEKLISEIQADVDKINAEYGEITEMYKTSPLLAAIQERYRTSGSKAETLAYAVTLERQNQTVCRENAVNAPVSDYRESNITIPVTSQTAVTDGYSVISGVFKVTCTKSQLIALRDFMKDNGISFEVVK